MNHILIDTNNKQIKSISMLHCDSLLDAESMVRMIYFSFLYNTFTLGGTCFIAEWTNEKNKVWLLSTVFTNWSRWSDQFCDSESD